MDYRKRRAEFAPIHIDRAIVETVESFKFFSFHITKDLLWSKRYWTTKSGTKRLLNSFYLNAIRLLNS